MKYGKQQIPPTPPAPVEIVKPEPVPVAPKESLPWFECVACNAKAAVLHRGTGYCKQHFSERNYTNTLVN